MKKPTVLHKKRFLYPISLHYLLYDINYGRIRPPVNDYNNDIIKNNIITIYIYSFALLHITPQRKKLIPVHFPINITIVFYYHRSILKFKLRPTLNHPFMLEFLHLLHLSYIYSTILRTSMRYCRHLTNTLRTQLLILKNLRY